MIKINENIIHDTFGEGQIVDITGSGNERKLMVHFIESGPKILLERLAKEKITYTDNIIDISNVEVEEKNQNNFQSNQFKYSSNSMHPQWAEAYERLKYYLDNNTNPNYKCPDTGKRYSFYFWLCMQKRLFRNRELSQDKIDMLSKIVDLSESKKIRHSDETIHEIFLNILSFVQAGNPIYKHKDSQKYYTRLRQLDLQGHKVKNLILEIKSTINSISLGPQKKRWQENYNALRAYVKEHNRMIPQYIEGDYKKGKTHKLYRWYYKQRGRFSKNKLAPKYVDKFSKLLELVNNADNRRIMSDINERLDKIKQYTSQGLLPPARNKDGSRNKLKVFLDNQVNYFRSGKMPLERVEQFNAVGFDLDNIGNYRKKIDEEALLEILNDIYLHLKEGKSMSAHKDRDHFYRRSSDKKRERHSDRVQKLIDKIKVESNKQKIEKPIIILKRILEHVKVGEPIHAHPSSSIYHNRARKYDIQAIEVQKLIDKIKVESNKQKIEKPIIILKRILEHVKVGEPIYKHPHCTVYYGRQKKKQTQTPEIQELLDKINIFIEANAQTKNPYYILSDILEFVKAGGPVNEHPKSNYYYCRLGSEEFLEEDVSVLIKEINYYIDLNQFSDAE